MRVHVVGNVCIDTTFRLTRFPEIGETLNAQECRTGLGGKGANQALAALRTGAETTLWAAVGQDAEADTIRRHLETAGLSARGLVAGAAPSDRSTILLDGRGENLIVSAVAAARDFAAENAGWAAEARRGDVLVMQNNLQPETTAACLALAGKRCLFTVFNASPLGFEPPPPLAAVNLVVVNRSEGERLTGERAPERILAALLLSGAAGAVVTLGPDGAALRIGGADSLFVPAPSTEAIDTSGAGDVFCGTLAGLLARGISHGQALRAATLAASLAVTRPGAFGCGPSAAEMNDILKEAA